MKGSGNCLGRRHDEIMNDDNYNDEFTNIENIENIENITPVEFFTSEDPEDMEKEHISTLSTVSDLQLPQMPLMKKGIYNDFVLNDVIIDRFVDKYCKKLGEFYSNIPDAHWFLYIYPFLRFKNGNNFKFTTDYMLYDKYAYTNYSKISYSILKKENGKENGKENCIEIKNIISSSADLKNKIIIFINNLKSQFSSLSINKGYKLYSLHFIIRYIYSNNVNPKNLSSESKEVKNHLIYEFTLIKNKLLKEFPNSFNKEIVVINDSDSIQNLLDKLKLVQITYNRLINPNQNPPRPKEKKYYDIGGNFKCKRRILHLI